ncbi:hypothetical protein RYZ26_14520 [Terasakiella sp. A23]|uniref:hypothetical protein n=1 Tax=Terasakiella sp. FCG-A23 TaxID=3080561 RepID=UPI002953BDD4|nr:hypothetical protein [Terasakiella sp. A23]MDV7340817.1 hypothetical protein [Terasakiella sp. A23]
MAANVGYIDVLTSDFVASLSNRVTDEPTDLWVFGGAVADYNMLKSQETDLINICIPGDLLNKYSDKIEDNLLNLDAQLGLNDQEFDIWQASLSAERSPLVGNLQLNVARFLVLQKVIDPARRQVFLFENKEVAQDFYLVCRANKIAINCRFQMSSTPPSPRFTKMLRARVSALKQVLQQKYLSYRVRKQRPRAVWRDLKECDVLLVDWVGENSFSLDRPTERCGNLERMVSLLTQRGLKVGFLAQPLCWTQDIGKITENLVHAFEPVVSINECRSLLSIVHACFSSWRMKKLLGRKINILGFDVSRFLHNELCRDLEKPQTSIAASYKAVAQNLAAKNINPKAIIYTFENQGWERALVSGIHKSLPSTKAIAYQHAPFARRYIGFFSSQKALNGGSFPDQILLMGEIYKQWFLEKRVPDGKLNVVGSLRFESLLNQASLERDAGKNVILCCAPIDVEESLSLVTKVANAVKSIEGIKLIVNHHPVVGQHYIDNLSEALAGIFGRQSDMIELSSDKAVSLFQRADLMVYSTTGVAIEAVIKGMPCVCVESGMHISFDKLPDQIRHSVLESEELVTFIQEHMAQSSQNFVVDKTVGGLLAPVLEDGIIESVEARR